MEKQQRIEKIHSWLYDVTGLEKQAEGTVGWLIEKAAEDPTYLARAGRKVWQAIHEPLSDGSEPIPLRNLPVPLNRFYEDQPDQMRMYPIWKDFFGIEETIAHFGNFFERAHGGYEEERQALWFRGPAGSGKTTFVRTLCERLEDFTFWTLSACLYHEHPLHVVPRRQREVLFETFYPFEGSPCSDCWRRLQEGPYDGKSKLWWKMPVRELGYSEGAACGIAFVDHRVADPTLDSLPAEWIEILQRQANGGLLIVQCTKEMQPAAFMELVGEITQSGRMNMKESAARVSLDIAVIFLANMSIGEYKSGDVALKTRVQECILPLVTSTHAEKQIVAKLNRHLTQTYHFMPHVEDALNMVVCASRLQQPGASVQTPMLLQRLHLYDGIPVEVTDTALPHSRTQKQMRGEHASDGVMQGMSIRSALKTRSIARELCENKCVTINDVIHAATKQLEEENFPGDANTFPRQFLEENAEVEIGGGGKIKISRLEALVYQKAIQRDLVAAWIGPTRFDKKIQDVQQQYLDHASAFLTKHHNRGFLDDKGEVPISEPFLRGVEKYAGMETEEKQQRFRREVGQYLSERQRMGVKFLLSDIPALESAIWKHEASLPLSEIQVAFGLVPAENRDTQKERKKIEAMVKNLADMGYQPCCIKKLLGNYQTTGYIRRVNLKL